MYEKRLQLVKSYKRNAILVCNDHPRRWQLSVGLFCFNAHAAFSSARLYLANICSSLKVRYYHAPATGTAYTHVLRNSIAEWIQFLITV